jgi:hypothetical protein
MSRTIPERGAQRKRNRIHSAVLILSPVKRFSFCPIENKAFFQCELILIKPSPCKMRIAGIHSFDKTPAMGILRAWEMHEEQTFHPGTA